LARAEVDDGGAETHKRWFFFLLLLLLLLRAQFGMKFGLEISEEVHRSAPRISRRKSGTQDLDVAAFFWVCFASFLARGVGIDLCSCHAPAAAAASALVIVVIVVIVVADFHIVFFFTERVRGYFLYLPTLLKPFFFKKIFCIFLHFSSARGVLFQRTWKWFFFGGVLADFSFVLCPSFLMAFFFVFVRFVRLPAPSPGPPSRKYSAEIQKNSDERRE
jgi:hypothetical protein